MPAEEVHRVVCHLDELLERRAMTLTELAGVVGVTVVNLSVLKNNRAKAVRYSTLTAICDALACQPGDLFTVQGVRRQQDPVDTASPVTPGSGQGVTENRA
jgi:putative transcriptional regulator